MRLRGWLIHTLEQRLKSSLTTRVSDNRRKLRPSMQTHTFSSLKLKISHNSNFLTEFHAFNQINQTLVNVHLNLSLNFNIFHAWHKFLLLFGFYVTIFGETDIFRFSMNIFSTYTRLIYSCSYNYETFRSLLEFMSWGSVINS